MSTLPGSFDQESETGETADSLAARFDEDWHRAERRFGVVSGYRNFRCDLADETGQAATTPHEGAPEIFERWKPLRTGWERRDLFSRCFLASVGVDQFLTWAVANVFVDNGRVEAALQMLERAEPPQPGADFYSLRCGAFAQALLALNRKEEALQWAQEAASDDPEYAGRGTLEPELRQEVEQRIRNNGWTTDGMQSRQVRPLTSGN
jgi:tetratricopeptide (TPR) repeat protein